MSVGLSGLDHFVGVDRDCLILVSTYELSQVSLQRGHVGLSSVSLLAKYHIPNKFSAHKCLPFHFRNVLTIRLI